MKEGPVSGFDYEGYWLSCVSQDAPVLEGYFWPDARIIWPCTEEVFTVAEFIRANCEYPGRWTGALLRVTPTPMGAVTECRIQSVDEKYACHVASLFTLYRGRIASLTEYYADDGPPPRWRQELLRR